jgi:hypothetical protein
VVKEGDATMLPIAFFARTIPFFKPSQTSKHFNNLAFHCRMAKQFYYGFSIQYQ